MSLMYQFAFYASGTVDNLTAMSSPVQMIHKNPTPGKDPELIVHNAKAFKEICGPILNNQLGDKDFMYGNSFSAMDVFIGLSVIYVKNKREDWLKDFPNLDKYATRLMERSAFKKANSNWH